MWLRSLVRRREARAASWSGLSVPAAIRVVGEQRLRALAAAAERDGLGWFANDVPFEESDLYVLLPYSYEAGPVPSWKCRVIALDGGLSAQAGRKKTVRYGRLDVSADEFRRLPTASRRTERQLVHWLGWEAASAVWRNVRSDQPKSVEDAN